MKDIVSGAILVSLIWGGVALLVWSQDMTTPVLMIGAAIFGAGCRGVLNTTSKGEERCRLRP